jgi:nifR3 family TIM-barrel protein
MAPMAGVSDAAWRIMARAGGAAIAYSEMVSVAGIHYGGDKTWELVMPHDPEPDLAVQLFGSDPAQFREAAEQVILRLGPKLALIDVNMACPVPKVVRKGEGSALMCDPSRASRIIEACRAGIEAGACQVGLPPVPVSCKIRRGFRTGEELAPVFARQMQEAGAQAIALHGRFADQLYRGKADWSVLARVANDLFIPVIASGDVSDASAAAAALADTGARAAMIARGTYGNPWVFADAARVRAGCEPPERPFAQRLAAFKLHVRLMDAVGTHIARARSLAGWYFRGIPDAAAWRDRAMHGTSLEDFIQLADALESAAKQRVFTTDATSHDLLEGTTRHAKEAQKNADGDFRQHDNGGVLT